MNDIDIRVGDRVVFKGFLSIPFKVIEVVPDMYGKARYNIQSAKPGGVIISRVERERLIKVKD